LKRIVLVISIGVAVGSSATKLRRSFPGGWGDRVGLCIGVEFVQGGLIEVGGLVGKGTMERRNRGEGSGVGSRIIEEKLLSLIGQSISRGQGGVGLAFS
jgi:hypothetical protein